MDITPRTRHNEKIMGNEAFNNDSPTGLRESSKEEEESVSMYPPSQFMMITRLLCCGARRSDGA
jgi:hypothetical protein